MKTELENLKKEFNERIDALLKKEEKPKFEVGNYFKIKNGGYGCIVANGGFGSVIEKPSTKPLFYSGESWEEKASVYIQEPSGYVFGLCKGFEIIPATESEIKEALIKEAEKRGFKEGVTIKDVYHTRNTIINYGGYNLVLDTDTLRGVNHCKENINLLPVIYRNGKWAEIVKDEAIKIGGYKCEFTPTTVKIGCKEITKNDALNIYSFLKGYGFDSITVDNHKVSLETILAILKKLN